VVAARDLRFVEGCIGDEGLFRVHRSWTRPDGLDDYNFVTLLCPESQEYAAGFKRRRSLRLATHAIQNGFSNPCDAYAATQVHRW
jgi:hypothetical protein